MKKLFSLWLFLFKNRGFLVDDVFVKSRERIAKVLVICYNIIKEVITWML